MSSIDSRKKRRSEISDLWEFIERTRGMEDDLTYTPSHPLGEEFRIVLTGYKKPTETRKKEERKFSPELLSISEAFNKLGECMKDLVDTLQVLPENIARCMKEAIHTEREGKSDVLEKKVALIKDEKAGKNVYVLDTTKELKALQETQGCLQKLWKKIEKEKIDTPDMVRRAWKRS